MREKDRVCTLCRVLTVKPVKFNAHGINMLAYYASRLLAVMMASGAVDVLSEFKVVVRDTKTA